MVSTTNLWACSASELGHAYARGDFSPVDVIDCLAHRIAAINPLLNAFVTLDIEGARAAAVASAARWRSGAPLSVLDGVPVSIKDNLSVGGMRSTWGSALYAQFVPDVDELPVARLRAAGVLMLGKTNCPELTVHGYTDNLLFGVTRNPWDTALTPGGSSGGAVAAVSAGLGPIALATDGGGSIRRPASYTGLAGLKPSRGRVARANGFPSVLLDCEVVGPIARTVEDIRLVMQVIGQPDQHDPLSTLLPRETFEREAPQACRILHVPHFGGAPVDRVIADSVVAATHSLESLGHTVETGTLPLDFDALGQSWSVLSQTGLRWLADRHAGWESRVGPAIASLIHAGSGLSAVQYYEALEEFARLKRDLARVFEHYDVILTPSAAAMPWPAAEAYPPVIDGHDVGPRGHAVFTAFANMSGCAAINLPAVPAADGMPIGFQVVGPVGSDGLLCKLGMQYEAAFAGTRPWPAMCEARV